MIPFTMYYSTTIVYSNHFHLSLSEGGGNTIPYKGSTGDKVVISGYSTSSINIYALNLPLGETYLGQFKGNFSKSFTVLPFKQILISGGNSPANVTANIKVYNTNFSGIGYTISGIFLVLGLILLWYSFVFTSNKSKIKKAKL